MNFEFTVRTNSRTDFIDITEEISRSVRESKVEEGICTIFTPHTTAAITINENADPAVIHDMHLILDRMIPWSSPDYLHSEGNSAAHVKSSLVGCSESVIIQKTKLRLGTWQCIYFCEFDGPRTRKVILHIA